LWCSGGIDVAAGKPQINYLSKCTLRQEYNETTTSLSVSRNYQLLKSQTTVAVAVHLASTPWDPASHQRMDGQKNQPEKYN